MVVQCWQSGPCIIRPPLQAEKYGIKLEVALKWKDTYVKNISVAPMIAGPKMEVVVQRRVLKSQGPLYMHLPKVSELKRASYKHDKCTLLEVFSQK